jgi:hypothetical protein
MYISTGRKPGGRKIPIRYLLDFIKKNNLKGRVKSGQKAMSDTQLAFAIQTTIWKRGVRGKNFWDTMVKMFEDMSEQRISTDVENLIQQSFDKIKLN